MMRNLQEGALRIFLALWLALTPGFAYAGSMTLLGVGGPSGFTPACSQSSTWLARTSGLSTTERNAYDTMICGMVTDGVWSKLDALWIFATNNTTTALLNLVSTSYTASLTASGTNSPTFTADFGYTAGASPPKVIDTNFIPSAGGLNYTQNSASLGVYVLNNRTTSQNSYIMGISSGQTALIQLLNSGNALWDVNDVNFPTVATTTSQGSWFATRTAASGAGALSLYRNGSLLSSSSGASGGIPTTYSMYILARNSTGAINQGTLTDSVAAAWVGSGFNATDVANFSSRLNAYMTALGINVY